MLNNNKNKILKRALVIIPGLLALGIAVYIIALPFYPSLKYNIISKENIDIDYKDVQSVKKITENILGLPVERASLPRANDIQSGGARGGLRDGAAVFAANGGETKENNKKSNNESKTVKITNTLIIPKIGVKIPIIESDDKNYGLNHGAWKLPKSSTPEEKGNMILTGHRFKYLPPSNLTFFLFNKLEIGDVASVVWDGKIYYYKIKEIKKVSADDTSILKQTKTPTLTMYTCDPIYSMKNRLAVIAEMIEDL